MTRILIGFTLDNVFFQKILLIQCISINEPSLPSVPVGISCYCDE